MSSPGLGRVAPLLLATLLAAAAGSGCKRSARTADEARARLAEAVKARDGEKLYAALDLPTRWSWMTVRRAHREAYDIILSNFPEGPERERQIARFEAGALSESEAALFAEQLTPARWQELDRQLNGPVDKLPLGQGEDGSWGYSGFAAEGEDRKRRASADLELMRTAAADFEKAAARAGK
jgi:hypothetical protein